MGAAVSKHPQSKQARAAAFCVSGGEVCAGVHMPLVLLELPAASGGVAYDLRRTSDQLPDGWYAFCRADGVTRPLTHPTRQQHQHQRPVLRRIRAKPAIRAHRPRLSTLYGQVK
jgi:hypothetical protein